MSKYDSARGEVTEISPDRRAELAKEFATILKRTETLILDAAEGKGEIGLALAAQERSKGFYTENIGVDGNRQDEAGRAFSNTVYGKHTFNRQALESLQAIGSKRSGVERKEFGVSQTRLTGLYENGEKTARGKFAKNSMALEKQIGYLRDFILTSDPKNIKSHRAEISRILTDLNTTVISEMGNLSKKDPSLEEHLQHWQGQIESLHSFFAEAVHRAEQKPRR